jgi:hypothetical protein
MTSGNTLMKQRWMMRREEMGDEGVVQSAVCRRGTGPPTSVHTPIAVSPDPSRRERRRAPGRMKRKKEKKKRPQTA